MKTMKYFSATWCGPCKQFKPIMQEIAGDGYSIEFIDVDNEENKAVQYGIRSVPTVVIEQGGKEVSRLTGSLPKQLVLERLAYMARIFSEEGLRKNVKKTRQGMGGGTKLGNKNSKKHYVKKYRGQGGNKRSRK